jgi:hypothetical protein
MGCQAQARLTTTASLHINHVRDCCTVDCNFAPYEQMKKKLKAGLWFSVW